MERVESTEIVMEDGSGGFRSRIHGVIAFLEGMRCHGRRHLRMIWVGVKARRSRIGSNSERQIRIAFGDFERGNRSPHGFHIS